VGVGGAIEWNHWKRRDTALSSREKLDIGSKFHAIFDLIYGFIGMMSPDGVLLEANRSALKLTGVKEADVLGKPFWDTPWWSHSKEMQDRLRKGVKAAARGEIVRFEATHRAADGSIHYVDFTLTPMKNENGKVIFLIPEGRDITDSKRREEAMNLVQDWQRTFDSIPDLIALIDSNFHIFRVNRAMADKLGCKPEDLVGIHCCEAMHGLSTPPDFCPHRKMLFSKKKEQDEFLVDRLNGYYEISASPMCNDAGEIVACVHIARDITKRKQAEEALRQSEIRYRALIENAPVAIFINRQDRVVLANTACLKLFGATSTEQLLGKSPFELFHPDYHEVIRERIRRLRDFGQVMPMIEEKIIRLDGHVVDVEATAAPFEDQGVNAIHVVLSDITRSEIVPFSVNLTAFPSRLRRI
jgi:PAS domain S-box-containing protein